MKIEKALEILTLNYKDQASAMPKDCAVALFMAMSAVEHNIVDRGGELPYSWQLLAGETEK